MASSIWPQMERLLHNHLVELCAHKLPSSAGELPKKERLDSDKLKKVLDSLYEMTVAIVLHSECRKSFYALQSRPAFGHLNSLLLDIFSDSTRDSSIRIAAANILMKLSDVKLKDDSADSLALILPGFFARCQRVALDNVTGSAVPYKIPQAAISLITNVISSVMWIRKDDKELDPTEISAMAISTDESGAKKRKDLEFQLEVQRDVEWFKVAVEKILPQLSSLISLLCVSNNHQIRLSTLSMIEAISEQCSEVFGREKLNQIVINLCVVLISDPYPEVKIVAENRIAKLQKEDPNFCVRCLSSKISKASKTFAKNVRDSASGGDVFQNLTNCLCILGPVALDRLTLASTDFLERLLIAILASIRVEKKRLLICSSSTEERSSFLNKLPLSYGLKAGQVLSMAGILGSTENIDTVFNVALENFRMSDVDGRTSAAILMASILLASTGSPVTAQASIGRRNSLCAFIDLALEYLRPLQDCLEVEVNDRKIEDAGRSHSDESCLAAVLVHGIAVGVVQLKEGKNCVKLMIDVLYEILKCTSSSNYFVKESAEDALNVLSQGNGYANVSEFLCHNASYVVFKVSLKCRDFIRNSRSPLVLSEMLNRCSNPEMFDQVQYIVDELLLALDRNDQNKTIILLRAIRSYVRALLRWFPDLMPAPKQYESVEPMKTEPLQDSDDKKDEDLGKTADLYESMESQEFRRGASQSPSVRSVVAVLNRTKHMISSTHLPIQILVFDILDDALKFVKNYEDDLLPMIHQNWHGLVRKLDAGWSRHTIADSQKLVAIRAVEVAETMCDVSGNFIYLKIVHELRPKLMEFLQQSLNGTECSLMTYPQTATCRLQLAILRSIPTFVLKCRLSSEHRLPLIDIVRLYSSTMKLPESLRNAAKDSLAKCAALDIE